MIKLKFTCKNSFVGWKALVVIFLFINSTVFAESSIFNNITNYKNINSKLTEIYLLMNENNSMSYYKATKELKEVENDFIRNKDERGLSAYYLNTATIYYNINDYNNSFYYLRKGLPLNSNNKNADFIGLYYELFYVLYTSTNQHELAFKNLLISKKYIEKYIPIQNRIDLYVNLTYAFTNRKDWDKVIFFGKKTDSIATAFKKVNNNSRLNLFLAEAYFNKNNFKDFEIEIEKVERQNDFKSKRPKVMENYYRIKSLFFESKGELKKAIQLLKISNEFKSIFLVQKEQNLNRALALENQAKRIVFNLEKSKIDNKLNEAKLQNQKANIIYFGLLIVFLLIILTLLSVNYKIKSNSNINLNKKNKELEKALSVKSKFLNTVAHELKTPLNVISSIIYLFKQKYNVSEKSNLDLLEYSTEHLLTLSNNIIDYTLLEKEEIKIRKTSFSLAQTLNHLMESLSKVDVNKNNAQIIIDSNIEDFVFFDKTKFIQVLNALLDNAFKFTSKGTILLTVDLVFQSETTQKLKFSIIDSGIGIEKVIQDKVFNLFFQGSDEISVKYGGLGIGLFLVKNNLALFGSYLSVDSSPEGTTVSFILDLEVSTEIREKPTKKDTIQILFPLKKGILIVEDNKLNQILIQKILNDKEIKTQIAENGQIAVDLITENDYDLILMDIMMPVMDGFQASKEIKNKKPEIPIFGLTAISKEANEEQFKNAKIDKVLSKPVNVDDLFAAIQEVI